MYEHMHAPANQKLVPEGQNHLERYRMDLSGDWISNRRRADLEEKVKMHEEGNPPVRDVLQEEYFQNRTLLDNVLDLEVALGTDVVWPRHRDHPGGTAW